MPVDSACPSCGGAVGASFYDLPAIPTNSCLLIDDREAARDFPVAPLQLSCCPGCGFIFNTAWEESRTVYSDAYEETQGFSPTFNAFHERLARDLISRHDLHGKRVVEIGCGKGEFLALLCRLGDNDGIGYDPSFVPSRLDAAAAGRARFIREFFDEATGPVSCDFLCCKMTLEHIPDVGRFIGMVRRALDGQEGTHVFFQVPNARRVLQDGAFWDIYYEHCSYFTAHSLSSLFERSGFAVDRVWTDYDDQYLMIEARPAGAQGPVSVDTDAVAETRQWVEAFLQNVGAATAAWRQQLKDVASAGRRTVLWGSGSKAVAFLTTLGLDGEVASVVDINPFRHGRYLPVTGHQIISPDELSTMPPDLVVIMNPVYRDEIQKMLRAQGCEPEIRCV
ncbi:methyltransferase domain-containing protein [Inquilinus limosus]|uniref:class I SAM-dependent methyltransferase n=1 Tax=Inquilinus limosus TaxID=171674 RepID=UPI003F149840